MPQDKQPVAEEEGGIWQSVLAQSAPQSDYFNTKSVLVLGDRNSGKSALLQTFHPSRAASGDGQITQSFALDYDYVDVVDESEDVVGRINMWELEGAHAHNHLLHMCTADAAHLQTSLALIVLDLSTPWLLGERLSAWLELLRTHVRATLERAKSEDLLPVLREKVCQQFQSYSDPAEDKLPLGAEEPPSRKTLAPLPEGALTDNLGIPIIVVCCKADVIPELEKEFHYTDAHMEFIQQALRRICLAHGASLIFTSSRKKYNTDTLFAYLKHLLFAAPFNTPAQVVDKERLFVPMGWDSLPKIRLDFEHQRLTQDDSAPFSTVIKEPQTVAMKTHKAEEVAAQTDEEFLAKFLASAGDADDAPAAEGKKGVLESLKHISYLQTPTPAPASQRPSSPTPASASAAGGSAGGSTEPEHQVLAQFFNSLINSKTSGKKAAATAAAPAGQSSRQHVEAELKRIRETAQK
mmetsp:Transcript_8237/g.20744  ORF Transcript_8237/g.20744 Transcript_8237/m.20744 type:complete len:465 (+) Transcript_8237:236-1630(+)